MDCNSSPFGHDPDLERYVPERDNFETACRRCGKILRWESHAARIERLAAWQSLDWPPLEQAEIERQLREVRAL